ncbi:MAG: FG-GAP repeat protein, partial [Planctomycetaceae bacterium]|nr:FG-GAP repeat protein [Planctomycetaceae bacterium]
STAPGGASAGTDQGAVEFFPTLTQPYVVGPGANTTNLANQAFDAVDEGIDNTASPPARFNNTPYPGFQGDVRVALADINGDGTKDIITGPGQGGGANIIVRNGIDPSQTLRNFFAYDPNFTGGVFVAAGDINGDGVPDIITGTGPGSANVRVFNGADTTLNQGQTFFPVPIVDLNPFGFFGGGVRVASGDINGDGRADVIVAAGPGGGAHVKVFSGATVQAQPNDNSLIGGTLGSFFPYGTFPGGVYVASGDVNGDGVADVITGPGPGGGPNVLAFTNTTTTPIVNFFAYGALFNGGVRVASVDFDGDKFDDIITGAGPTGGQHVRIISSLVLTTFGTPTDLATFFPYDASFTGGVFVAGSKVSLTGGSPLRLAEGISPSSEPVSPITNADLTAITEAAIARFEAAGASETDLARLETTSIQVADLGSDLLGLTLGNSILIDADAAGIGFFVDVTPGDDLEFQTATGYALAPEARDRVDLLTVVLHEFAHVLGLPDLDSSEDPQNLMADRITPGLRRFVREEDLNALDTAFQPHSLENILD